MLIDAWVPCVLVDDVLIDAWVPCVLMDDVLIDAWVPCVLMDDDAWVPYNTIGYSAAPHTI